MVGESHTTCPHCGIIITKKSLKRHIQRKHSSNTEQGESQSSSIPQQDADHQDKNTSISTSWLEKGDENTAILKSWLVQHTEVNTVGKLAFNNTKYQQPALHLPKTRCSLNIQCYLS